MVFISRCTILSLFFLTVTLSNWNNCYYEINVLRLSWYTIFTRGDLTFYTESFTREGIKIREAGFQKFAWGCCRNFRRPVHCVLCKTKNFIRSSRTQVVCQLIMSQLTGFISRKLLAAWFDTNIAIIAEKIRKKIEVL